MIIKDTMGITAISIHALLAESDYYPSDQPVMYWRISIHALLAESDLVWMLPL